jgi:hypothetical protein
VTAGSIAAKASTNIKEGCKILEINGTDVSKFNKPDVMALFREASSTGKITFVLDTDTTGYNQYEVDSVRSTLAVCSCLWHRVGPYIFCVVSDHSTWHRLGSYIFCRIEDRTRLAIQ